MIDRVQLPLKSARLSVFSSLSPPLSIRWIPTPSCPKMKGRIKETPQGRAGGRNFGI